MPVTTSNTDSSPAIYCANCGKEIDKTKYYIVTMTSYLCSNRCVNGMMVKMEGG